MRQPSRVVALPITKETSVPFTDLFLGEVGVGLQHLNGLWRENRTIDEETSRSPNKYRQSLTYGSILLDDLLPMLN